MVTVNFLMGRFYEEPQGNALSLNNLEETEWLSIEEKGEFYFCI